MDRESLMRAVAEQVVIDGRAAAKQFEIEAQQAEADGNTAVAATMREFGSRRAEIAARMDNLLTRKAS